ncbi:hypothetical protein FACS1894192_09400 [Bacilli bacterium]|nr:hypothetical protein FACS1894192_09400 [Bacilli bacterium]
MNNTSIPSRDELKSILNKLINDDSKENRKELAMWAFNIYNNKHNVSIDDSSVEKVIYCISMVDLIDLDSGFLYGKQDFENWLKEL